MDGRICNRGRLPRLREPLTCGRKQRHRPADACGPRPPAHGMVGSRRGEQRPHSPPCRPAPVASRLIAPVTLQFPK